MPVEDPAALPRVGNAVALDLVNLVEPREGEVEREHLQRYGSLVRWAEGGGLVTPEQARRLERRAMRAPELAAAALDDAIAVRELLHRVFEPLTRDGSPAERDLQELAAAFGVFAAQAPLRRGDGGHFDWAWDFPADDLTRPLLGPAVSSAIDLLRTGPLDRIKACPVGAGGCGWLFLDTTKNRSRRWCSMADCGASVKSRRYYERHRASGAGASGSGGSR